MKKITVLSFVLVLGAITSCNETSTKFTERCSSGSVPDGYALKAVCTNSSNNIELVNGLAACSTSCCNTWESVSNVCADSGLRATNIKQLKLENPRTNLYRYETSNELNDSSTYLNDAYIQGLVLKAQD